MASVFEQREAEAFRILKQINTIASQTILVGGYALNAYSAFPRFSLGCDLTAVADDSRKIGDFLTKENFKEVESGADFARFEKKTGTMKIGIDLFIDKIIDRQSGITFDFSDIAEGTKVVELTAKSNPSLKTEFRTASPEILFVMKLASFRKQDIRDAFMLSSYALNKERIQALFKKYFTSNLLEKRAKAIKKAVESTEFRDSLQGVYGRLPDKFLQENRSRLLAYLPPITSTRPHYL